MAIYDFYRERGERELCEVDCLLRVWMMRG